MGSLPLPVPSSSAEVTPTWIEKVTGHSVSPEGFEIEGEIQEGIGFLSSICRVTYKTTSGDSHNLIVKLLPTNPKWLEFALLDASDEREMKFYSIVAPDLLSVIPEIEENLCKYHNGTVRPADPQTGSSRQSMLILDDLKPSGFRMMDFAGSDSPLVMDSLITFMARLHFGAFAIEIEKKTPLPELYPFMQSISESNEWHAQLNYLCDEGYKLLETLLTTHNMTDVWKRYEKLKPYTDQFLKEVDARGRKFACLAHTDVWPPNIQIHDTLPVKVIDWQLLGFRDVIYDLSVLLLTVPTKENLTKDNLRRCLRSYYDTFETLCKSRGFEEKMKRRSWEEFEKFFFTWGAAFGFILFLPSVECYAKDYPKFANVFRFLCEDLGLPEFLENACQS